MKTTTTLLFASLLLSGTRLHAQLSQAPPFPGPTHPRAIPDYGNNTITFSWTDNSRNETGFQVYRSVDGGAYTNIAITLPNATSYVDAAVDTTSEYRYKVRAANGAGWSRFSAVKRQNLKTVWPVPTSHEILHNWNETIGSAAVDELGNVTGFHMGVDIQRIGSNVAVVAVQGGIVTQADEDESMSRDGVVVITTRVNGVNGPLFQTNHVDRLLVSDNEVVYAGQKIAEISESAFPDAVEHTHYVITNANYQALQAHPLGVFPNFADRDPMQNAPGFVDHAFPGAGQPGSVLFKRQGAGAGVYLTVDATHPLEGDVDIIVEFGDVLGTSPDQVPTRLGYWIEQPPQTCAVTYHDVQDPANAYLLFAWEQAYFGDATSPLAVSQAIMDTFWDYGSTLPDYPGNWPNYKHFVLTNTSGTSGAATSVDAGQHWNTNAEDDGASEVSAHANYAGFPDTTRARFARFPDGVYTIHVIANDLIQDAGPFLEIPVRLENFNPIVCDINPFNGEVLPSDADEVGNLTVTFNEPMDMTVNPATIMSINNGASLQNLAWLSPVTLRYDIVGMQGGQAYQLTVAATAVDLPGVPGNRPLDGNEDGVGGDSHVIIFSVAP